jgi:hypothetical protein
MKSFTRSGGLATEIFFAGFLIAAAVLASYEQGLTIIRFKSLMPLTTFKRDKHSPIH